MCPHKVDVNFKYDLSALQFIARHRRLAIEECIDALTHSCLCHDAFCRRTNCMKMKRVVIHTSICLRKVKGNCPICKQLIALCCYHAKNCMVVRCRVPFCNTVKAKMRQQNLLHGRLDMARGLLRAQPDPAESDAIDVNMAGPPPFGEDGPSGSGSGAGAARDAVEAGSSNSRDSSASAASAESASRASPERASSASPESASSASAESASRASPKSASGGSPESASRGSAESASGASSESASDSSDEEENPVEAPNPRPQDQPLPPDDDEVSSSDSQEDETT